MNLRIAAFTAITSILAMTSSTIASETTAEVAYGGSSAQSLGRIEARKNFASPAVSGTNVTSQIAQYGGSGGNIDEGMYAGATLALIDFSDLGGSVFLGYQLDEELGIDAEFIYYTDGLYGIMGNARYMIPVSGNSELSPFASAGAGISILDFAGISATDFTWQIKGGVEFETSPDFDLLAQLRLTDGDLLSGEIGIKSKF